MRKILASVLAISLLSAESLLAQQNSGLTNNGQGTAPGATESAAPVSSGVQKSYSPQYQSPPPPRPYPRETGRRRHRRISKEEVVVMTAVAGNSMGIGALAGGGMGLAVGAIVGGWGAYATHKLWHWLK
jgi:hypothetical protein